MACLTSSTANIDVTDSEKEENYEWTRGQRNCAKHPANLKINIWFKSPRITEILQSRIWLNCRNMSTVGRGEYKCDYNLMWRMWKLSKVDVKNNAVIEVKTSQWLDRHSTMQDTLSTVLMMRPLQVKTSIKQWFEDSSEDCSSIQILVLWFQTVNKFVFLGETFYSLGPIFWENLSSTLTSFPVQPFH